MPDVVLLLVVRLGVLVLLWLFVFAAVRVIRDDVFGPRVPKAAVRATPKPAAPRAAPKPPRTKKTVRHLVITQGPLAGTTVELGAAPITIGRAPDSSLVIADDYASAHHARLTPRDGQWLVEDLGSTNGTYLDNRKLTGPTPVGPGGKVRIGKTVLELRR